MTKPELTDEEFAALFQQHGTTKLANRLGISVRNIASRRARVEGRLGIKLVAPTTPSLAANLYQNGGLLTAESELGLDVKDGVVLVGSDGHYWPGLISTAHRALVAFTKKMKPRALVFNGDAVDGASVSRHPPIGWEDMPSLAQELECVQERLGELEAATPKGCERIWTLGNHDARFNTRLASVASEFRDVEGTRLVHHFPLWRPAWAVSIGGERGAVIKHRFKGGIHATHNNAMWAGRTMITGHLHSQKITPFTDYNGTRWGVDTGCIAAPRGPQFAYSEANPANHRSGFAVLTWKAGVLLPPELVMVHDEEAGEVIFRGEIISV